MIGSRSSYAGSESESFWSGRSSALGGFSITGERVDEHLRDVFDDGECARHVGAVQRGVTRGHLALVAGGENEPAELVAESHENGAADAGLEVLAGEPGVGVVERLGEEVEE